MSRAQRHLLGSAWKMNSLRGQRPGLKRIVTDIICIATWEIEGPSRMRHRNCLHELWLSPAGANYDVVTIYFLWRWVANHQTPVKYELLG